MGTDSLRAAVNPTIHPDRILADLAALIAIPSVTGDEIAVQDHIAELLTAAGLDVTRIDADPRALALDPAWPGAEMPRQSLPVVAGTWRGRRTGPRILLVGHVDVVPPGDVRNWSSPPFDPVVRDGHVYGRGACDMKGGVAAAIEAIRAIAESGIELAGEVVMLTVPSEEDGGGGALAAIRAGFTGDMAVIPEPTRLDVVTAHAGAITFTLDVPGKAAHASTRREGVSALDKVMVLLQALSADEQQRNAVGGESLDAGNRSSISNDHRQDQWRRVGVNGPRSGRGRRPLRSAPWSIGRRCGSRSSQGDRYCLGPGRVPQSVSGPAGSDRGQVRLSRGARGSSASNGIADAAERVTGRRPALVGVPYGADMRMFVTEGDTPCVMYGPGDVRLAHSADERVPLDEVVTCARVLCNWLETTLV